MARNYYGRGNRGNNRYYGKKRHRRSRGFTNNANDMRGFAYKMGCVERGLSNPNSQISASFNAGKEKVARERKPLY